MDEWRSNGWFVKTVFLFGDNDDGGKRVNNFLQGALTENGLCDKAIIIDYPKRVPFKDPNQFLICDREWFKRFVQYQIDTANNKVPLFVEADIKERLAWLSEILDIPESNLLRGVLEGLYKKTIYRQFEEDIEPMYS